jgi:hypothetical protein
MLALGYQNQIRGACYGFAIKKGAASESSGEFF